MGILNFTNVTKGFGEGTARLAPGTEAARPEDAPLVLDLVLH